MAKLAKKTRRPAGSISPATASDGPNAVKPIKSPKGRKRALLKPVATIELTPAEDRLARLARAIEAVKAGQLNSPRTTKLLSAGVPKMAQKLMEEAAETAIDAVRGERAMFVNESADLLYNLVALWSAFDVAPAEIWAEMDRREQLLSMAEKLPKPDEITG
jgi:phosphoribosyl-ATP pyrophosphohydrolase